MSKNVSVCLSFDFDAISIWLGSLHSQSPSTISRGEFAAVGSERLLEMLRRYQILSSWFIPGHTLETYPQLVQKIATKNILHSLFFKVRLNHDCDI